MKVLPVNSEYQGEYAKEVTEWLKDNGIRAELDDRNEKLGYRLREVQTSKIPYTIILGDNEKDNKEISFRLYGEKETTTMSQKDFLKHVKKVIDKKSLK